MTQSKLLDHRSRHKRIGPFSRVIIRGGPQETVTIGMHLQHAEELLAGLLRGSFPILGSNRFPIFIYCILAWLILRFREGLLIVRTITATRFFESGPGGRAACTCRTSLIITLEMRTKSLLLGHKSKIQTKNKYATASRPQIQLVIISKSRCRGLEGLKQNTNRRGMIRNELQCSLNQILSETNPWFPLTAAKRNGGGVWPE